jgi:hypothetical protein
MATAAATLIKRYSPQPDGSQNVDVLVNDTVPNYWVWGAHVPDATATDAQVQTFLTAHVAQYLSEIAANNEQPLTADQVAQYQDLIDISKASTNVATINSDIALITTASPDPNAGSGYKQAFTAAAFNALTATQQTTLIRNTISAMLQMLLDIMRAERLLLNIAIRAATGKGSGG